MSPLPFYSQFMLRIEARKYQDSQIVSSLLVDGKKLGIYQAVTSVADPEYTAQGMPPNQSFCNYTQIPVMKFLTHKRGGYFGAAP